MADIVLRTFKRQISQLVLVPDTGGLFEVSLDGDLVFSKKEVGHFPENDAIIDIIRQRLG